jgi:tetratricopeptide (TPR) repeat protein
MMDLLKVVSDLAPGLAVLGFALAIALVYSALRWQQQTKNWLVRTRPLKTSMRESVEFEMGLLERTLSVLESLYEIGLKPKGESVASPGEIEWLDSKIPGPLRTHYEDIDFLLDLYRLLKPSDPTPSEKVLFARAYRYAGLLAFKYHDLSRAANRFEAMVEFGEEVLAKAGTSKSHILYNLGTTYMYLSEESNKETNLELALVYLRESWSMSKQPEAGYNLAWCLDEVGKYDDAIQILHQVINQGPSFIGAARLNLACALVKIGKYPEALSALAEIAPDDSIWKDVARDSDLNPLREAPWKEALETLLLTSQKASG